MFVRLGNLVVGWRFRLNWWVRWFSSIGVMVVMLDGFFKFSIEVICSF